MLGTRIMANPITALDAGMARLFHAVRHRPGASEFNRYALSTLPIPQPGTHHA